MKTLLILLASATLLCAVDTNQVRRIGPRGARPNTNAVITPKPAQPQAVHGPIHQFQIAPGVRITVQSTNQFSVVQLRRWLQEAARTVK